MMMPRLLAGWAVLAAEATTGGAAAETGNGWSWAAVQPYVFALGMLVVGALLISTVSRAARRAVGRRLSPDAGMLLRKIVFYTGWVILLLAVLNQLGVKLTAILAAAGVAGIAIGFAAQTTLSNMISGIFLAIERPFRAGDMIQVGDTLGIVLSVDLLSVKLRQFDNRFVRIPNETLIKGQVTNYSRFPIRRVDLMIGVAYKEDIGRVREVLLDEARKHPLALQQPEPLCFCWQYNTSSIDLLFVVWGAKDDFLKIKSELLMNIKKRFDDEGIEIPFPHVSLYAGAVTDPVPVRLSDETLQALSKQPPAPAKGT
jgi:small-conductance mechanosensitive channel